MDDVLLARATVGRAMSDPENRSSRALMLLRRYGSPALLLSWVPALGDAIVALAGAARVPFGRSAWTVAGKAARYAIVAWLALRA